MGNSQDNEKTKIIPDLERIVPDDLSTYSRRLLQEHIDRYNFALRHTHNKIVADIACGSGYGSYLLADKGAKKVIGIDRDKKTIRYATGRYKKRNIIYQVAEANNLPMKPSSIDVVVSFETIEHIKKPITFIYETKKVLKKEGLLVISTPNKKYSIGDNPFHFREFDLKEFNQMLKSYFRKVTLYGQRPVFKLIMPLYQLLSQILPSTLLPFLHMRPWERLDIRKLDNICDDGYVYFIAICQK